MGQPAFVEVYLFIVRYSCIRVLCEILQKRAFNTIGISGCSEEARVVSMPLATFCSVLPTQHTVTACARPMQVWSHVKLAVCDVNKESDVLSGVELRLWSVLWSA